MVSKVSGVGCLPSMSLTSYSKASWAATHTVPARSQQRIYRSLNDSGRWYDFTVKVQGQAEYRRRLAGRLENGLPSISDPTMSGPAVQDR